MIRRMAVCHARSGSGSLAKGMYALVMCHLSPMPNSGLLRSNAFLPEHPALAAVQGWASQRLGTWQVALRGGRRGARFMSSTSGANQLAETAFVRFAASVARHFWLWLAKSIACVREMMDVFGVRALRLRCER